MTDTNTFENLPIAWKPSEEAIEKAQLTKFMKQIGVSNWDELYSRSIEDVESFTEEVLRFLDIKFDPSYEKLLDISEGIEWAKWCVGGGLNITEMCLDRWIGTETEDQAAIIWEGEKGECEAISYRELLNKTARCANGLRQHGLKKGDAIGIHLPMIPETVIALLAINRIGAIAVPVFSGYGVEAIASRMNAVKAKALIMCDGFYRRGKKIDVKEVAFEAAHRAPSIEKLFLVDSAEKEVQIEQNRESSLFGNSLLKLYPEIEPTMLMEATGYGLKDTIEKVQRDFFNAKGFEIDPSEFFEKIHNLVKSGNFSRDSQSQLNPLEVVCFEYQEQGVDIKPEDFQNIYSDFRPVSDYKKIAELLIQKGYEIDLEKVEAEMENERIRQIKAARKVKRGMTEVGGFNPNLKPPAKYAFDLIPWMALLIPIPYEETPETLEKTSANDPLIILYSSGTTGKPKGIAHVHCGFPVKAAQDMAFGTDVGKGTRISWVTDIGWMMGPWLIYGALINGATMVLYDGSPDYPKPDRMWEFCAKHKVEILGVSPTLIRVLSTKGDDLPKRHDLSNLRAFASTGEPWNPAPWYWLFEKVGDSRIPIINYSGGTEISGGILMGNLLLPQKPGSFPAPCPGIAADILDESGESAPYGEVGELAIRKPWIGMAQGFWEEPERYLKTYWSRFEKIWVHGDFAMRDKDGHWYILGRSDDTLNVAGKRVGPAEIESILVADERIAEAAVIGVPDEIKGTAMVAFCVLSRSATGAQASPPATNASHSQTANSEDDNQAPLSADDDASKMLTLQLESELKSLIAKDMGKPLTPKRIHFVSALPKTRNAKVMRRVIRSAYLGEDAGDLSALENPKTVEEIRDCK